MHLAAGRASRPQSRSRSRCFLAISGVPGAPTCPQARNYVSQVFQIDAAEVTASLRPGEEQEGPCPSLGGGRGPVKEPSALCGVQPAFTLHPSSPCSNSARGLAPAGTPHCYFTVGVISASCNFVSLTQTPGSADTSRPHFLDGAFGCPQSQQ